MADNQSINNLFTLGFIGLVILLALIVFLIFGSWKFYKTPEDKRGGNNPKLEYFILLILVINFLTKLFRHNDYQVSRISFVISMLFLLACGHLFLIKKVRLATPKLLVALVLGVYAVFQIIYFLK